MSKFLDKGKLRGYIDSVLEMRDLKSMNFETSAALTWVAADILQQIGECRRAAEILDKLSKLRTNKISFDGIDIRKFNIEDLRNQMGIVSQDTFLFNDTIENNIR